MNSFGQAFRVTSFGESHASYIGGVLDGFPAGLFIDEEKIQAELDKRKSGKKLTSQRKEADKIQIISGVFQGYSTGSSLAFLIKNEDAKSKDYEDIKDIFRPNHADFTYFQKYKIRDYRGGGRASARESAVRVAAGAFAKLILDDLGIKVQSGIFKVGKIESEDRDFDFAEESEIFSLSREKEEAFKEEILKAKQEQDSVGAGVLTQISNIPPALGEELYYKFDAKIAEYLMGINGVKAVEVGDGILASSQRGSQFNDEINKNGFLSNHSGGILGGITTGEKIIIKTHFKPTPSIFKEQRTINTKGEEVKFSLKGRHDPCIALRGTVVVNAMLHCLILDMLLLNLSSRWENVRKFYS